MVFNKAMKDNDDLRLLYGLLKVDHDNILFDLNDKDKKRIRKVKKEMMILKRQVNKCRTTFTSYIDSGGSRL